MKPAELQEIGNTLLRIVQPDMKPKQLLKAIQKAYPKASKQDIVRAAFFAIIANADAEPERARKLQAFALVER
jgi:hypothetical protein